MRGCIVNSRPEMLEKMLEWAKAQCEDTEIQGALVYDFGLSPEAAEAIVIANEGDLQVARWNGRREVREWIYKVMQDSNATCKLNGVQYQILGMFARQHLGYAKEGIDDKVRAFMKEAERRKAKGSRPELVKTVKGNGG